MGQPINIDDFPEEWELKLVTLEQKARMGLLYISVFVLVMYLCFS